MTSSNNKTSYLVSSQLPFFVRNDHETFTRFLEAYYEFLEQEGQALDGIKGLKRNYDIDTSVDLFVDKFYDNFLKLIPKDAAVDRTLLTKHINDFYRARGTEKSIKFLMKILFNEEDVSFYYPKQDVLRASDGKWYVEKSLKISDIRLDGVANTDINALNKFVGTEIKGNTSSATAIVERVDTYYESSTLITELKISNQYKTFSSGEPIFAVFTENGVNRSISANLFSGSIASVTITAAGSGYTVGDTVGVESANGSGAVIIVSSVTSGNVKSILINDGGAGFQAGNQLLISGGGGSGANANISAVKADSSIHPNSYNIVTSTIQLEAGTQIGNNKYSNLSVSITNAANQWVTNLMSSFVYSNTGPIQSVLVLSGGTSYTSTPTISAQANNMVRNLGILGKMKIVNPGSGYAVNDTITFNNVEGGYGSGAAAKVSAVNATGAITGVQFVPVTGQITGGSGYDQNFLPTARVISGLGTGADIRVTATLGSGEDLRTYTGTIGSISTLSIISRGSGYGAPPVLNLASKGDGTAKATATVIQGAFTYPGRYLNDDGHLSGYNFIQDRDYYQNYSYVVKLKRSLQHYRKALKELIHPAGMKVFGEYPVVDDGESMNVRITGATANYANGTYTLAYTASTNAAGKLIIVYSPSGRDITSQANGFFEFGVDPSTNLVSGVYQTTTVSSNTLRIFIANTAMVGTVVANNGFGNTYTLQGYETNFTSFATGDAFTIQGYSNTFYVGAVANNNYLTVTGDYLPPYITGNTYARIFLSSNTSGSVSVTGNVSSEVINGPG